MNAVLVRIITRYLSGALVAYGLIDRDAAAALLLDPDLALLLGGAVAAMTELAYGLARRNGWER